MTNDVSGHSVGRWSRLAGGPDLCYGDLALWSRPGSGEVLYLQVLDGPVMAIHIQNLRELLDQFEREWPTMSAAGMREAT